MPFTDPIAVFCTICDRRLARKCLHVIGQDSEFVCGPCESVVRYAVKSSGHAVTESPLRERTSQPGYIWKCASCHKEVELPTPGLSGRWCTKCQDLCSLIQASAS